MLQDEYDVIRDRLVDSIHTALPVVAVQVVNVREEKASVEVERYSPASIPMFEPSAGTE